MFVRTNATATAMITWGVTMTPSAPSRIVANSVEVSGSRSMRGAHRPDAHADRGRQTHARQGAGRYAERAANEEGREHRPAAERTERQP